MHNVKYHPFPAIDLPDRQWPGRKITDAPRWLDTSLRDGNQSIQVPMDAETKLEFFRMLVDIGFKEIEVGFPSASETEFTLMRRLIGEGHVPEDVNIQVLTQARPDLIARTMESIRGLKQATVHIYSGTSEEFMQTVLGKSRDEVIEMAKGSVRQVREAAAHLPETDITLEYSAEHFTQTDISFARDVFEAVMKAWGATPDRKVILNMPATVEICDPEEAADMIEWMDMNLENRDAAVLSFHPHNDRGTAVAAAQMAIKAGADRVEGCLFGNGERTGNVALEIIALNLFTRGVDPKLDFSDMPRVVEVYERATGMKVPPRHPYAGELVYTAFSGSHQDAMYKGFEKQKKGGAWNVPYLAIDPADLGFSYDGLIRFNSQSGKGGATHILKETQGIDLPKGMQPEFGKVVQARAEETGGEVSPDEIWQAFEAEYLADGALGFMQHRLSPVPGSNGQEIALTLRTGDGEQIVRYGRGNGPVDAAVQALDLPVTINNFIEHSLGSGADARAIAYVEMKIDGIDKPCYGAGIDTDTGVAAIRAVISGVNRLVRQGRLELPVTFDLIPERAAPQAQKAGFKVTPGS